MISVSTILIPQPINAPPDPLNNGWRSDGSLEDVAVFFKIQYNGHWWIQKP